MTLAIRKIAKGYAILPLAAMLIITYFVYWVTPYWTNELYHYSMVTVIDELIPFKSVFVVPYIFAYIQWAIGYVRIAQTDRIYSRKILYGAIFAKLITGVLFIIIPTTMERAVITNDGIFDNLVKLVYKSDPAINLFPSIHCLDSWICLKSSLNKEYFSRKYVAFMGINTFLVILSTVFIKQHVIADVIGAIVVAETGLYLSKKLLILQRS